MSGRRFGRLDRASAVVAGPGKFAQVRCRHYAVRVRRVLDGRGARCGLARLGSRNRRICSDISGCQRRSRRARAPPQGGGRVMTVLTNALRELAGLFVDDGALALMIIAVAVLTGVVATLLPEVPLVAGGILLLGFLTALLSSVARANRRSLD